MDNIVLNTLLNRRAIRAYSPEKLTDAEISAILDAALISPSAVNRQPWHISAVSDFDTILSIEKDVVDYFKANGSEDLIQRIESRNNKIFYNAPFVCFISVDSPANMIDVGIMAQSIAIAAKGLGLDSVILGLPAVAFGETYGGKWENALDFPEGYSFGIAVAVGHGDMPGREREQDYSKVSYIK